LTAQKRICQEFADKHGYKVKKIFVDAGKSGKDIKGRPAFMEMVEYSKDKHNQISAIIVQHTDRFARNVGHHNIVKSDLKKHGIELLSVAQPNLGDTPEANMMDNVSASFNQYWSDIISYKTKIGMEERARKGWQPNMSPVGYLNVKNDKGENIIAQDPDRAPFIKRIFEMYITGEYGGEKINDIMYEEGLRTRYGNKLPLSKLFSALENPFYYGEFRWNGKIWPGKHKPIVTKEIWALAQRIRKTRTQRKNYERKYKFLLTAYVFCDCGYRLTAEHHFKQSKGNKSTKTFSYYHCTRGRKCKKSKYVTTKDLEKQVEEIFKRIEFSDEFNQNLMTKLKEKYHNHKKEVGDKIKHLNQLKAEVIKKRNKAEEMLFNSTIKEEVYQRCSREYEKQTEKIEEKINELGYNKNICVRELEEIMEFSKDIYKTYKKASFEVKRMFLGFFWDKFILKDKKIIKAIPTPLFSLLQQLQSEMNKKSMTISKTQKTPSKEPSTFFCDQSFINFDRLGG